MIKRVVGGALVLVALAVGLPRPEAAPLVDWAPYSDVQFEAAQNGGQPVIIDVYADWCIPCVEMDHSTFRNPAVVKALAEVATLRVDATSGVTDEETRLLERFDVFGAPTVLLFDRTGKERTALRLTGFENAEAFLERLEQIL